jgi:hypothetical protein
MNTNSINGLHEQVRQLNRRISGNELALDRTAKAIERDRELKAVLVQEIERAILEESIEYPTFISLAEAA